MTLKSLPSSRAVSMPAGLSWLPMEPLMRRLSFQVSQMPEPTNSGLSPPDSWTDLPWRMVISWV